MTDDMVKRKVILGSIGTPLAGAVAYSGYSANDIGMVWIGSLLTILFAVYAVGNAEAVLRGTENA